MTLELRSASLTDVGRTRERNEDACFAGRHTFAVADGLGGHRAGEVASALALESITELDALDGKRAAAGLGDAVRKANRAVHERAASDIGMRGMGTTMTAVVIDGGLAHIAHVGDSRCYLIRGGMITQLSADHTLVAGMVADGKITPEQAETHPQRSILTRALGADRSVDVAESQFPLDVGDRLVLCSDGLTAMLSDEDIRALSATNTDLDEVCSHLIDEANARGGVDNITAVVIDVEGTPEPTGPVAKARAPHRARARAVPTRLIVWVAVLLTLLVGGGVGVRMWADRTYYVGVSDDHVAIYRGIHVQFAGIHLSHVEESTAIRTEQVAPYYLPELREGVIAKSLEDARRIVSEQIPRAGTPAPVTPLPGPTP